MVEIFYAKGLSQCVAYGNHFEKLPNTTTPTTATTTIAVVIIIVVILLISVDVVIIDL